MKSMEMINMMERADKLELRRMYSESLEALLTAYNPESTPAETVEKLVKAAGYRPALLTICSMINVKDTDGRISPIVRGWASGCEDALDREAALELGVYSDRIHPAHLSQIGSAMMSYNPLDHYDSEPTEEPAAESSDEINELAPDHITLSGVEMAAEWSVSSTGRSIYAFYTLDGERFRLAFTGELGELFYAAKSAAKSGQTTAVDGDDLALIIGDAVHLERKPAPTAPDPAKERHGEVPEKWFIGQELTGKSWRILFDGDAGKTRVIFPRKPSARILEAVKAAGFYWSPSLKSWNKGLTFRAFRAAEKLHAELFALA